MKYKIKKQFTAEILITEIVEVLRKEGVLPADMKPEHDIHAGKRISSSILAGRTDTLFISWQETEEIGKDGLKKKDVAVSAATKLRAGRKKKGGK